MIKPEYIENIGKSIGAGPAQVSAALELLNGGASIPFIARYRRDVTGDLNEEQLETISEKSIYYTALNDRRRFMINSLSEQGALTDELAEKLEQADNRLELEDLFLPYNKRQRTKAVAAEEKGLAPLADFLQAQDPSQGEVVAKAGAFVSSEKAVSSPLEALEGASEIVSERIAHKPEVRQRLRERMLAEGKIASHATKNAEGRDTKYRNYYDFSEEAAKIPSHRFLAIMRGAKEGFLRVELQMDDAAALQELLEAHLTAKGTAYESYIRHAVESAYNHLLRPAIENDVMGLVRQRSEDEAIRVFRENAKNILLTPPYGRLPVMGVEALPEQHCALAVVDGDGKPSATKKLPLQATEEVVDPAQALRDELQAHGARAVAIGNSSEARQAAQFVREALAPLAEEGAFCVFVNDASATAYANSKAAREELPDMEAPFRKAVSTARYLQDPLAELVKVEPRHIGVGQYQHDVHPKRLRDGLHRTLASCVNRVGVNANRASRELLSYVSGIQPRTAESIIAFRDAHGPIKSLQQLVEVEGVGPRVFEQCAGFLRIDDGEEPLDASAIHPETYPIVDKIAESVGRTRGEILGQREILTDADLSAFSEGFVGPLTLDFIRRELIRPGRDPRREFKAPKFVEGVTSVEHIEQDMVLEGVVTNVTDFGVFVDVGVNQDGLVHLSELANRFVRDPRTVAKVGDVVKVKVLQVDKEQPRISLSIKALLPPPQPRKQRRLRRGSGEEAAAQGGETGGQDRERSRREGKPSQEGKRRRRPKQKQQGDRGREDSGRQKRPAQQEPNASPMNTQLADQLAALKDKLNK
jgi:uncharacterized protein